MIKNIAVVGGDLRIVKLVEMLQKEEYQVKTYALEKATEIKDTHTNSIFECIQNADIVLGPLPLSTTGQQLNTPFSDTKIQVEELINQIGGKSFIAGSIKPEVYQMVEEKDITLLDIIKREELAVLNAISTAEGAIQIAINETPKNLHGNNVLVLGFGRIGKVLSKMLDGIGAKVACEARKTTDLAWIKAYGYEPINLIELKENLNRFDIIINTIPYIVLTKDMLQEVKKDTLIIDLASNPGGVDRQAIKELGIKFNWALSLPGKVSPITSAEFMKETLLNMFKEIDNQ
ncbi:MAG: dipicolinate synthase subunit DpsA [Clostridia bacterium]|nr:dipicolinate synthase subunit DpsA [Clostridia bacterium]